jgi:hypothetical protein
MQDVQEFQSNTVQLLLALHGELSNVSVRAPWSPAGCAVCASLSFPGISASVQAGEALPLFSAFMALICDAARMALLLDCCPFGYVLQVRVQWLLTYC